jgi:hypothetical protein
MLFGAAHSFHNGIMRGNLAEAVLGVDGHSRALLMDNDRARIRLKVAATDGVEILAHAYTAMRIMADKIAADERSSHDLGDVIRRARGHKDTLDKFD